MKHIIITIDGPAASGKGTIAKYIKKNFSFYHIDSGLFYRNLAKIILDNNIKNSCESFPDIKLFFEERNNIFWKCLYPKIDSSSPTAGNLII